ncbi:MAG: CPXCG motif-containing cysteine-rich protein [Bacteroidota bacterium]
MTYRYAHKNELIPATYECVYCGEENETLIDITGGSKQSYTEDCAVCCRPNLLTILLSPNGNISMSVEFEE